LHCSNFFNFSPAVFYTQVVFVLYFKTTLINGTIVIRRKRSHYFYRRSR